MKILVLTFILALVSCEKGGADYLYHYDPPAQPEYSETMKTKDLIKSGDIDILWVVDNSGSMSHIQDNIIANARIFMEEFVLEKHINWKMGLLSSRPGEDPYLGFKSSFDHTMINHGDPNSIDRAVSTFQTAFQNLGASGGEEYLFYVALQNLLDYDGTRANKPSFLRSNAHLAVIFVTDEKEWSYEYGGNYAAIPYLNTMGSLISSTGTLRFYGAFDGSDIDNCSTHSGGQRLTYETSPFKTVIEETEGFAISACTDNFGLDLASIGKDIASIVDLPSILLGNVPENHSIRLTYKGKELPTGPKEEGGIWFYVEKYNIIQFYSIDFIEDIENDEIEIFFEIDDGNPRPDDPEDPRED